VLEHLESTAVKPKRVVIMGAGGFVGSAILRRLTDKKIATLALSHRDIDLLSAGASERLATHLKPEDTFIAVSALAPVKNLEMLGQNIMMLRAMTEALSQTPPRHILNIGSDAVFGDEPLPLTEMAPKAPSSLHGIMHASREIAFADIRAPLATLRPTLIYGAADPHNGYGPNRFFRLIADGKNITLFGEGEERRDHVAVEDVADLAVRIVLRRSKGSLHAATGEVWSFRAIAEMAVKMSQRPITISGTHRQEPMPHGGYRPFDVSAIRTAFPDFRYTSLPEGLARMWRDLSQIQLAPD
jgi:nucleoside-diphosphate-sugar epimerase